MQSTLDTSWVLYVMQKSPLPRLANERAAVAPPNSDVEEAGSLRAVCPYIQQRSRRAHTVPTLGVGEAHRNGYTEEYKLCANNKQTDSE